MKPSKIVFINKELEKIFIELDENDPVKKGLTKTIDFLKEDAFLGRRVKKDLIPKKLIQKYEINNLWICNLPSAWRMLYSLSPNEELEIVAIVLDWMNHKDYEELFKF
jgi:hypothetical protein